jgi:hypothetical protein
MYPQYVTAFQTRCTCLNNGTLTPLPSLASNQAALAQYFTTLDNLWQGFENLVTQYAGSDDLVIKYILQAWQTCA